MGIITKPNVKVGVDVGIKNDHILKYPEHRGKVFKVLSIDNEGYCECEWIQVNAKDRIVFIPKAHLTAS